MKCFWIGFFVWIQAIVAEELPMLYDKNHEIPCSSYEIELVNHVKLSMEKAIRLESKLNETNFAKDTDINIWPSDSPSDHLLNNLCNLPGASHLHVGLLKGGSFVAALYGNQEILNEQIGLDWFKECPKDKFTSNCARYLEMTRCTILDHGCFDVDKALFVSPIDIYFYDADHSLLGHQKAFTYYDEVFANVFVAVVDDWKCPWVRRPTFKAFEKLGYRILYETIIPANNFYGHGQYVAVIKKSTFSK
jgi:hypothetical protein